MEPSAALDPSDEPGLRERKKARTRTAISDVATALFVERGFERVTVAEIAAAADVSVKTVFNYFAAKEDLFFDRADELVEGLAAAIAGRPPGTSVAGALRALLADNLVPFPGLGWRRLRDDDQYESFRGYVAAEEASPALRARRLVLLESWAPRLSTAVGAALGLPEDDARVQAYAWMVLAAMALRRRVLSEAVLARRSARTVERNVRAAVDEAFGRIERAFADVEG